MALVRRHWRLALANLVLILTVGLVILLHPFSGHDRSAFGQGGPTTVPSAPLVSLDPMLAALQARAAHADGTWTITTPALRRNAMPRQWSIGMEASAWSMTTVPAPAVSAAPATPPLAAAPTTAPSISDTLYYDGSYVYSLRDNQRLSPRTLAQDQIWMLSPANQAAALLFFANLRPREFISQLGSAEAVGNQLLDGTVDVDVRVTARIAPIMPTTPDGAAAAAPTASTRQLTYDFLYDPGRQMLVRLSINDGTPTVRQARVTDFSSFGAAPVPPATAATQWPAQISTSMSATSPSGVVTTTPAQIITIAKYDPANGSALTAARQQAAQSPLFITSDRDLGSIDDYRKALAADPGQLSDQVALAQALLRSGDFKSGLSQWATVQPLVPAGAARSLLDGTVGPLIAQSIWQASSKEKNAADCAQGVLTLSKLASDAIWSQVSLKAFWTYENLVIKPAATSATADAAKPLVPLLGRFAASTDTATQYALISLATRDKGQGTLIEPLLDQTAAAPVSGPLAASAGMALVNGAIQLQDIARAQRYLGMLHPAAGDAAQAANATQIKQVADAVRIGNELRQGHAQDFGPIVGWFDTSATAPAHGDPQTTLSVRHWLIRATAGYFKQMTPANQPGQATPAAATAAAATVASITDLMKRSSGQKGSQPFWQQLLGSSELYGPATDVTGVSETALTLAGAFETTFNAPGQRAAVLMRLADIAGRGKSGASARKLAYLNRALSVAPDDRVRLTIIARVATVYTAAHDWDQARKAIATATTTLTTAPARQRMAQFSADIAARQKAEIDRGALAQAQQNLANLRGQASFLQDRLADAKRRGASDSDIASIQRLVDQTQSALNQPVPH